MRTQAAILVEIGKPLELAELEIPPLGPGQVLVEIACSGVCHTQLLECRGERGPDPWLPHCLGHEGSGTVVEPGPGAAKLRAGDPVVLSWLKGSGAEAPGAVYRWEGKAVNAGGVTTFMRHAVVSENRLTRIPPGLGLRAAALLGCAAATGFGAVLRAARARAGQSLAVFGAGGVGSCAVAAAAAAGCDPVVAVDVDPGKLARARELGATHAVLFAEGGAREALRELCPEGLDLAIEASGAPEAMRAALACVRPRGGTAVVIGNARAGERLELDPRELNQGKRLLGTWGGDSDPDRDFPRWARLLARGRPDPERLLSAPYRLDEINRALDDLAAGRVLRPLIELRT
jgi:S-(hydroxymethyl)glutathione dehydrogenase/alcohol dehydrogenase